MVSNTWFRIIIISIALVIGSTSTVYAVDNFESVPPLNEHHTYVQDHANIFTESQIEQLQMRSDKHDHEYELMIVTMKDLNGSQPKAYAKRLFDTYQLGYKPNINSNVNGVIILFDGQHQVTVYTDAQLSHYFTDEKVKELIKETTESDFEQKQYSEGLIQLYEQMEKEIPTGVSAANENGIELKQPKHTSEIQNTSDEGNSFADDVWFVLKYGKWLGIVIGTFYLIFAGVAYVSPPAKKVEESTHARLARMRKLKKQREKSRAKKDEKEKEERKNKKKHSAIDENKKYKNAMRDYKDE